MPFIRYTVEQLFQLRQSPLCQKPPGLPAIEQWMEVEVTGRQAKQRNTRTDDQNGNEAGLPGRPAFSARMSGRNASDEVHLGPPTLNGFTSNRNRHADKEKGADRHNLATFGDDGDRPFGGRSRNLRNHEEALKDTNNMLGRRNYRDNRDADGEGWSTVNRRRGSQTEESADRWRLHEHRGKKEGDGSEEQPRRGGPGRRVQMGAWRDEHADSENPRGGNRWRERAERDDRISFRGERDRERDRERDWTRGHKVQDRVDEEPEWLDEPVTSAIKEAKTAEDFEKFMAAQRAKRGGAFIQDEKEELGIATKEEKLASAKPLLDLSSLGKFGAKKEHNPAEPTPDEKMTPLAGLGGLGPLGAIPSMGNASKTSKFGAFFKKDDTPPREPEPQVQAAPVQQDNPATTNGTQSSREDAEGFQHILQMLRGGARLSSPPPQQGPNGNPIAQMLFAAPAGAPSEHGNRSASATARPESANLINELIARTAANRSRGPPPANDQEVPHYFPTAGGLDENAGPRGHPMLSPGLQMKAQRRPETPNEQKRDFLLKMIESDRAKRAQQPDITQHMKIGQMPGKPMMPGLLPMQHEGPQRITPSAPPGLDSMFGGRPEMDMPGLRKTTSRPQGLPSFFEDGPPDPAILHMPGLVRRNTSEPLSQGPPPGHRPPVSNMGIPSQNAPGSEQFRMNLPPPPPGQDPQQLPPRMNPPPGFNMLAPVSGPRPSPGFPQHLQQNPQGPPGQQHAHLGPRGIPPPPGMFAGPGPGPGPGHNGPGAPMPPPGYFPQPFNGPPVEFFMQHAMMGRGMPGRGGGPPPPGF